MSTFKELKEKRKSLAVIGLGYVGLPLALAFAKHFNTIGFDISKEKVHNLQRGYDDNGQCEAKDLLSCGIHFTSDEDELKNVAFFVVAVPTPINIDKTPDLAPVIEASKTVGRHLSVGNYVVYESTVYPGVTEDVCAPILSRESKLNLGTQFKLGYSPERINPGDKIHTLPTIKKIISGIDAEALDCIRAVYDLIIDAGTYSVSTIRTAEAVKLTENSQRDINIAFINEMAMAFNRMDIDTNEVIDGMNTKWNALGFRPGLVGGHCIGVDPYYFIYEAEKIGLHSLVVSAGRLVNDNMGTFVADAAIKQMVLAQKAPFSCRAAILGITFKEDCPDIRNTKVVDIIKRLSEYGVKPFVSDPVADPDLVKRVYGIELYPFEDLCDLDCVILAVAHSKFKAISLQELAEKFRNTEDPCKKVLIDVKGIYSKLDLIESGYRWWRL